MFDLEEPPPPQRAKPARTRNSIPGRPIASLGFAIALLAIAATVAALQLRIARRVAHLEHELAQTSASLAEARGSLSLLWTTTTRLDATQAQRADSLQLTLQDSIESVQAYAENEFSRFWQTAYLSHERRLDETANRIRVNGEAIGELANATGRTHTRIDDLVRQDQAHQATLVGVNETVTSLRNSLASLDRQIVTLDDQITALDVQLGTVTGQVNTARGAQAQLGTRIDGVEEWVDGFREEGLSASIVQSRLAALVRDLRLVAMRVDSLRATREPLRRGIGNQ
jgi:chromosome segregation ATPase